MKKYVRLICYMVVALFILIPSVANAKKMMQDESIYDVIVDRFMDANPENNASKQSKESFMGGDFEGIQLKSTYFKQLKFTYLSIGSIAKAEDYRGKKVIDYGTLQPYLGTEIDYQKMREALKKEQIQIIADFPINGVSEKNTLIPKGQEAIWTKKGKEEGTIEWNLENKQVKKALMKAASDYAYHNQLDGIRLTGIQDVDPTFLNDLMLILKTSNPDLIVLSDGNSDANFDVNYDIGKMKAFQEVFKKPNTTATSVVGNIHEDREVTPRLLMIDDVNNTRFSEHTISQENGPSPQMKLALTALFMLPGTPMMMYGTENEMDGVEPPDTLEMMEFKKENDLKQYIQKLQTIRSENPELRNSAFKLLHHQDGFIVFERHDEKNKWIIVINNTDQTQQMALTENALGKNQELVNQIGKGKITASANNKYRIALNREEAEVYKVQPKERVDFPYLSLIILVILILVGVATVIMSYFYNQKKQR